MKKVFIIAGTNGVGKTTIAKTVIPFLKQISGEGF